MNHIKNWDNQELLKSTDYVVNQANAGTTDNFGQCAFNTLKLFSANDYFYITLVHESGASETLNDNRCVLNILYLGK